MKKLLTLLLISFTLFGCEKEFNNEEVFRIETNVSDFYHYSDIIGIEFSSIKVYINGEKHINVREFEVYSGDTITTIITNPNVVGLWCDGEGQNPSSNGMNACKIEHRIFLDNRTLTSGFSYEDEFIYTYVVM